MTNKTDIQPSKADRIVRERERLALTSLSRSHTWKLEQQNLFPRRIKLSGSRSVGWRLSELTEWIENRPRVDSSSTSEADKK
ncbi:helix-turn-helix transcriptional regulator [Vibrio diazotrophicus]|uniref:helix-turn-helix transcriptional regulator n=1 Tax=Vibrio diazotrophicus TaxID=685 RepID=UPI00142E2CA7|nr:AlpA family phage regulatory protein [Vibrio diazotrophicus]NIY92580.1 AlpA family phage regulatory protein [Vibrio diazotrophicus]